MARRGISLGEQSRTESSFFQLSLLTIVELWGVQVHDYGVNEKKICGLTDRATFGNVL